MRIYEQLTKIQCEEAFSQYERRHGSRAGKLL